MQTNNKKITFLHRTPSVIKQKSSHHPGSFVPEWINNDDHKFSALLMLSLTVVVTSWYFHKHKRKTEESVYETHMQHKSYPFNCLAW